MREVLLSFYVEAFNSKEKKEEWDQSRRCCEVFESIERSKDRVFPTTCYTEFTVESNPGRFLWLYLWWLYISRIVAGSHNTMLLRSGDSTV